MMSKKGIKIKQFDITDCGAACLASVCAYYGLQFPIARIRQYAFTDQKGTNILGLIEAANKLGLSAKGVRAKFEALYIVPKPVIAHVIVHEQLQHFVVIYKVEKKKEYIEYMDPGDGRMHRVTNQEFEKMCTGVIGTGRNFQDRKHENRYDKEVLFSAGSSQKRDATSRVWCAYL